MLGSNWHNRDGIRNLPSSPLHWKLFVSWEKKGDVPVPFGTMQTSFTEFCVFIISDYISCHFFLPGQKLVQSQDALWLLNLYSILVFNSNSISMFTKNCMFPLKKLLVLITRNKNYQFIQREKLGGKVIIHLVHIQSDRYYPFICVLLKHFKIWP